MRSRGVIIFNTFNIVTLRRIIFFKFRRRRKVTCFASKPIKEKIFRQVNFNYETFMIPGIKPYRIYNNIFKINPDIFEKSI